MTDSGRDTNAPLVSVVLAVYNGAKTLRQTLQSVLTQTYPNLEVWVVDDGSTDETPEVLRSMQDPRLRVLSLERNVGRSQARNLGARKAAGELLAMIDADDLWYPDKLAVQARFLEEHRDVALCGAWAHLRTEGGNVLDWKQPTDPVSIRRNMLWMNPFIHCTLVVRKDAFLESGGYDPALHFAEDYDLALRIARRSDVANVPHFLAQYRYHTSLLYRWRDVLGKTRARARALRRYGYPLLHFPCLLTPLLSAWLPLGIGLRVKPYVEAWRASSESPTRDFLKSAFFKALAVIAGTYAIARVATLASQVWAGKALGVSEYGAANVVLAAAAIFHIVLAMGLSLTVAKHVAEEKTDAQQRRLVSTSLAFSFSWIALWTTLLWAARPWLAPHADISAGLYRWALAYAGINAFYGVCVAILQGLKRFPERGQIEVLYGLSHLAFFGLALSARPLDFISFIGASCAALILGTAWTLWKIRAHVGLELDGQALRQIARYSALAISAPVGMALTTAPARILLNRSFSTFEVGALSAYFTSSIQIALSLLYMLNTVLVPWASNPEGQRKAWRRASVFIPALLSGGAFVFTATCAVALKLYGKNYPFHGAWIFLFGAAAALVLTHGALTALFAARDFSGLRISAAGSLLAGTLNLVLNLWLTPRWGVTGAILSLSLAYLTASIWYLMKVPRQDDWKFQ